MVLLLCGLIARKPRLSDCMKLLKGIEHEFNVIGGLLLQGDDSQRLTGIKHSSDSVNDKLQSMLQLWLKSDEATWDELIDALKSIEKNMHAKSIRDFLGVHQNRPAGKP